MTRWVEWVEPFGPNSEPVYMRCTAETAIAYQRARGILSHTEYETDEQALDDFCSDNWATIKEDAGA